MSLRFPSRSQLSTLALLACVVVLSSCAGYDHQNAPELARIDVSTSSATIAVGATQQFAATGHFNDGSTQDITTSVAWTSQNTAVATINAAGLVSAKSAGSSAITAASGGLTSSMSLTVVAATLKSLVVTPANPAVIKNATQQFTATGTFSDGSTQNLTSSVVWSSATPSVATIASTGLATAISAGSSIIQAASGSITGTTSLTVTSATLSSIAVTPANPSIAKGLTDQFVATGTFSDGTTQNLTSSVTWISLTTGVATISAGGLAKGIGVGSSTIQATSGSVMGSTVLSVSAATLASIAVTPSNPAIVQGATQQFTATGTYSDASAQNLTNSVTWTSSTTTVATISASGLATSIAAGSSTIQATLGSISGTTTLTVSASAPSLTSIAVTPANPSIQNGSTQQFTATGTYSDASTKNITATATWTSVSTNVATISNTAGSNGLATSVGTGSSTIQATLGGVTGSTSLTVNAAGSATLTVLVVSPQNPLITDASSAQAFTATGHYSDGTTQDLTNSASWTSSNASVATVDSSGTATSQALAAGQSAGFTSIKATVGTTAGVSILSVSNHTSNTSGFAGVFTQHNDNLRTGQNVNETILTPTVVKTSAAFGKKFSHALDGYAYAQPLYVPGVIIGGTVHNVVFVATENDSVYAFDADSNAGANANPLWQANLIDAAHGGAPGASAATNSQVGCTDLVPKVGITSTPVIDPSTGTMYVETKSSEGGNFPHRLHAIDITTGNEKFSGPMLIAATVNVPGGTVTFDGLHHLNRPGLLWLNGVIYLAYASHCDNTPYHGWLLAYDASNLTQKAAFLTTPEATTNGGLAGFWMSGAGVAADSNANIFITTGNGDFDTTNIPAKLLGDTVMKLFFNGTSVSLVDYFTPYNQGSLDGGDTDLGSGGTLLLPDQNGANPHELVQVGKSGTIYVINRDQFTAGNLHYCKTNCNNMDAQIAQEITGAVGGLWSMPAYWNNSIYFLGVGDSLKSFSLTNGALPTSFSLSSGSSFGYPGATPSISADGNSNGIVWAINTSGGAAVLDAYDPANGLALLYSSATQGSRDTAGSGVKFAVPTIANGKVFVGTQTELDVYGTLP
jgi:Bacterial Ig-like domain (group 2)